MNYINIKQAAFALSQASEKQRNIFLENLSAILVKKQNSIRLANIKDVEKASSHLTCGKANDVFIDRLQLDEKGIENMALRLSTIMHLKSGIGEIKEERNVNGLILKKRIVPLGVIAVIYEARPEVTIDAAALCIKSGNAVILKGGSEADKTNKVLFDCICIAIKLSKLSIDTAQYINTRKQVDVLLSQNKYVDVVIARGGYALVNHVMEKSNIPVLAHANGGARIYVDKSADLILAEKIILNAKVSKPSACNAIDTILVHNAIASEFIPKIEDLLKKHGVEIVENDWNREFLSLRIGIKIVENVDSAITFINTYGKKHSEGIIATDKNIIDRFVQSIDTASVFVNSSTRLHDGYVFGMGAEMGIATGKLHARGPVGLKELTTYKWEVYGNGQIRE
jgi:glutamate-5-semialdehyde dehydrogenase